jgi:hypothetical protein
MGYVKLLAGKFAGADRIGATVLVPADDVASVKNESGDVIIKYFGGHEIYFSIDGNGTQADVDAFIEAIDKANGITGSPIFLTLPGSSNDDVYSSAGIVQAWS